jgi:hypothetical protein
MNLRANEGKPASPGRRARKGRLLAFAGLRPDEVRRAWRARVVDSPLALREAMVLLRQVERRRVQPSRLFPPGRNPRARLPWMLQRLRSLASRARSERAWGRPADRSRHQWTSALLALDFRPTIYRRMAARQEVFSRILDALLREIRTTRAPGLRDLFRRLRLEAGEPAGALRRRVAALRRPARAPEAAGP